MNSKKLERSLGLVSLIAYGVGDILGAGIYALIGKVAGLMGTGSWLAFLFAFGVASLTAFSYAELGSRFPRSAGESFYSLKAFSSPLFSYVIGFLVLMSGVVSMAVVSHAFTGYVHAVWPAVPAFGIITAFFLVLGVINFWGMRESSLTNIFCTLVEVSGILIVIAAGLKYFGKADYFQVTPAEGLSPTTAFFRGSILGFYAFIGFEDMVKAAEESHQPEKFIPRAILTSLAIVAVLYVTTAFAAVSVVPAGELARSSAPLMLVVERGFPAVPKSLFTFIALFAVTNTALVNFVMGSRLLYGMAEEGLAPSFLGRVHSVRHTPHWAIGTVFGIAFVLALTGNLIHLAQSTSLILLSVFFVMNLALIRIKWKDRKTVPSFRIPTVVPCLGAASSFFLIFYVDLRAFLVLGLLILLAVLFYAGSGRRSANSRSAPS